MMAGCVLLASMRERIGLPSRSRDLAGDGREGSAARAATGQADLEPLPLPALPRQTSKGPALITYSGDLPFAFLSPS